MNYSCYAFGFSCYGLNTWVFEYFPESPPSDVAYQMLLHFSKPQECVFVFVESNIFLNCNYFVLVCFAMSHESSPTKEFSDKFLNLFGANFMSKICDFILKCSIPLKDMNTFSPFLYLQHICAYTTFVISLSFVSS